MTRSSLPPLLLVAMACSVGTRLPRAPHGEAVLQVRGAVKGAPFHLAQADLDALKQGKARGIDPVTGRDATYQGVDLAALLDRLDLTGGADTLLLRTGDGRAVPVPLQVIRALRPVLAGHAEGSALPARLVAWPNVAHHGVNSDPRAVLWWARDVVALELVSWARVMGPALHLPEGAPAGALAGATAFGTRCLACHRVRRTGGTAGPELARGGKVPGAVELAKVLPGHPGWASPGTAPPRPEVVSQLAAFLWTVARTPEEDEEAEQEPEKPPPLPPPPAFPLTPPR